MLMSLGLAWLFWHYARVYPRAYLKLWAYSFLALGLTQATGVALGFVPRETTWDYLRLFLTISTQVMTYLQIGTLLLGAMALRSERELSPSTLRAVLIAAIVLGLTASLVFAFNPDAMRERMFARNAVRLFLAGAAYIAAGLTLIAEGRWRDKPVGQRLVGVALIAYGFISLYNFVAMAAPNGSGLLTQFAHWVWLLDVAAVLAMAFGLVMWLHEDEQRRADSARATLTHLTYYDTMTGLPNRRLLLQQLEQRLQGQAERSGTLAMIVTRPDHLRQLRGMIGEVSTARLLARSAQILRMESRDRDAIVARLEDDRIAAVLIGDGRRGEWSERARGLSAQLSQPAQAEGLNRAITHSLGVAEYPRDGGDAESLLTSAISAHARAESEGDGHWAFFNREASERERRQFTLVGELRAGLPRNELELFFQPIVHTRDRRLAGAEALIRWRHPERGVLEPDQFLRAAEAHGLMPQIDRHVIVRACEFLADMGKLALPIAVNASAQSFQSPEFALWVTQALEHANVPGSLLEIEITEAAAMHSPEDAARTLTRLHRVGVRISLDDFGVGYSSLSHLKYVAADRLKIDRSFTADIERGGKDAAIAKTLIDLSSRLGMDVVAEGIETETQLNFYRENGCALAQGFLLGRPMEAANFRRLIEAQAAAEA